MPSLRERVNRRPRQRRSRALTCTECCERYSLSLRAGEGGRVKSAMAGGLGPAGGWNPASWCLAGLEGHARPAQFPPEPDQPPVMRALIKEQRLAGGDAMDINRVLLKVIRKRLLDIKEHAVKP